MNTAAPFCSWQKRVVVDTHAHLYPFYSLDQWFDEAIKNLTPNDIATNGDGVEISRVVCLVDRNGQDSRTSIPTALRNGDIKLEFDSSERHATLKRDESVLELIFGTQSVAKEGIEVLGLGVSVRPSEGAFAEEIIQHILNQGGLPVLPWSPGKWLGKRGRTIHAMLNIFGPQVLTVGDVAIRSTWGPPSALLHHAKSSGFAVLYGSDPLPFSDEEKMVGAFGLQMEGTFSGPTFLHALLSDLRDGTKPKLQHGLRCKPMQALQRFTRSITPAK